jgi:hypothetical protein
MGNSKGRAMFRKRQQNQNELKRQLKLEKKLKNDSKKTAAKE